MNVWNETRSMDFEARDVAEIPNLRPGEAEALTAWLSRPRLPAHPRTFWERAVLGELPWHAQREADRAIDRVTSPYALGELLDARDLEVQAAADLRVRLSGGGS